MSKIAIFDRCRSLHFKTDNRSVCLGNYVDLTSFVIPPMIKSPFLFLEWEA